MYLADTGPRVIHAFTFDAERGTISGGRVLVNVPEVVGPRTRSSETGQRRLGRRPGGRRVSLYLT